MSDRGGPFLVLDVYEAAAVASLLREEIARLERLVTMPERQANAALLLDSAKTLQARLQKRFRRAGGEVARLMEILDAR